MWTGLLAVGVLGAAPAIAVAGQATPMVTFTKDIAPILQRSCQNCHRPDALGPMSLLTYEDVRPWAKAIKRRTSTREMPPWFIERNVGIQKFRDDPSLTDGEIAKIASWADSGAPRGNPADAPPPRQFPSGADWSFGTPDLVVSSPVRTIKAVEADFQGDIGVTRTGLTEDRYIKAVEVREVRLNEKVVKVRLTRPVRRSISRRFTTPRLAHGPTSTRIARSRRAVPSTARSTWCTSWGRTPPSIPTIWASCYRPIRLSPGACTRTPTARRHRSGLISGSSSTRKATNRSTS